MNKNTGVSPLSLLFTIEIAQKYEHRLVVAKWKNLSSHFLHSHLLQVDDHHPFPAFCSCQKLFIHHFLHRFQATGMQIRIKAMLINHTDFRLPEVGKSQKESSSLMSSFVKPGKPILQFQVSIIRIMLIDDIADKGISRRRLHPEATATAAASQPSPPCTQIIMHNPFLMQRYKKSVKSQTEQVKKSVHICEICGK